MDGAVDEGDRLSRTSGPSDAHRPPRLPGHEFALIRVQEDPPLLKRPLQNTLQILFPFHQHEIEIRRPLNLREVARTFRSRLFLGRWGKTKHLLESFVEAHARGDPIEHIATIRRKVVGKRFQRRIGSDLSYRWNQRTWDTSPVQVFIRQTAQWVVSHRR